LLSLQEAQELRIRSSSGLSDQTNLPQRIRALEGRALAYSILKNEAEAEFQSDAGENLMQLEPATELSNAQANAARSNGNQAPEVATLLPAELPAPFFGAGITTNFYNIRRKQRQQLKIAAAHQEKAKECLREVRNRTKFHALLKEQGDPQAAKILGKIIAQLKNKADYHAVISRQTEMRAYGHDRASPGAHNVIAQGNYELEFPVRPPSDAGRAQEVRNPKEDLIRLPKTKAIPLASVKFSENKKLSTKAKQQLPVAEKIMVKEATAEPPRNLKFSQAEARIVSKPLQSPY